MVNNNTFYVLADRNKYDFSSYGTPFAAVFPDAKIEYLGTTYEEDDSNFGAWEPKLRIPSNAKGVMFTGGSDVTPALYGETPGPYTHSCLARDMQEKSIYLYCLEEKIPMFGICRGSQFLAVMRGHKLNQHIDHHGIAGQHLAYPIPSGTASTRRAPEPPFLVTSTHHQSVMPLDNPAGIKVLLMGESKQVAAVEGWMDKTYPIVAVQYHPEYMNPASDGFIYFADLIRAVYRVPVVKFNAPRLF